MEKVTNNHQSENDLTYQREYLKSLRVELDQRAANEINKLKPTCIIITETHLKPEINSSLVNINGYVLFRRDRAAGKGWGGVAIYVAHSHLNIPIQATLHPTLNNFNNDVEALWINLTCANITLLVAGVYRPTHYTYEESDKILFDSIKTASESNNTLFIVGDFNLPDIQWPLRKLDGYNTLHSKFVELLTDTNLYQLVTQVTRIRNQQESLLDLVLCNDENLCTNVEHLPNIGKSDHQVLMMTIQLQVENRHTGTTQPRRNFFKADYKLISQTLQEQRLETTDVCTAWTNLQTQIDKAISLYVPMQRPKKTYNVNKPWIGSEIIKMTQEKAILWNIYITDKTNTSAYKKYRRVNNKIVSLARSTRVKYEREIVKNGPKSFHAYVRQQITSKVSVPPSLKNENTLEITSNQTEVANLFAEQFEKSYVREPDNISIPKLCVPRVQNSIETIKFTPDLVTKYIKTFDDNTAMGPDNIPAILLKKCAPALPKAHYERHNYRICIKMQKKLASFEQKCNMDAKRAVECIMQYLEATCAKYEPCCCKLQMPFHCNGRLINQALTASLSLRSCRKTRPHPIQILSFSARCQCDGDAAASLTLTPGLSGIPIQSSHLTATTTPPRRLENKGTILLTLYFYSFEWDTKSSQTDKYWCQISTAC
ncbi:endonuclease-reverse transcriptase domain-containing protein [Phthorimaea operculella]|nr:endonuclease-reverse transcriptase domain-containing protein [Phthorimaea operculella]